MPRPSRLVVLLWVLLAGGLPSASVWAVVTQTVSATGSAAILGADQATAFEQAKQAALREAVEQAAGTLVTASTQVEGFSLLSDAVLLQTAGFVRRYRVLSQGVSVPGIYEVRVEAEVDLGILHQQLEASNLVIEAVGNPLLLCLGREVWDASPSAQTGWGVVAVELAQGLKQASGQFRLLDSGAAPAGVEQALELARQRGAEVLVVGEARLRPLPDARVPGGKRLGEMGIHSAAADLQVRLIWVDTGEAIALLSQNGRAAGSSVEAAGRKAAAEGAARLAPQVVKRLLKDWRQKAYGSRTLQLRVEGTPGQLRRFSEVFAQRITGIEGLRERSFSQGVAAFDARARCEAPEVARQLSARGLGDLNTEILGVTGNTLRLKLSD